MKKVSAFLYVKNHPIDQWTKLNKMEMVVTLIQNSLWLRSYHSSNTEDSNILELALDKETHHF